MEIINNFIKDGKEKLHILTDFDGTLTKQYVNGEEVPSAMSILRNSNYISKDYAEKAHALANFYKKIEDDVNYPADKKKKEMEKWWSRHFELLIKSGLNKNHLRQVSLDKRLQFREGVKEFTELLYKNKIPLVIMSSSGIGEVIPMLFERERIIYSNIHIITNYFKWDKQENAIGISSIIHCMNKDEVEIKNHSFYNLIKNRKNVILLGNSLDDLGMITGFDYNSLLKIGFLKEKNKNFDICLSENDSFDYINNLMRKIVK